MRLEREKSAREQHKANEGCINAKFVFHEKIGSFKRPSHKVKAEINARKWMSVSEYKIRHRL